MELNDTIFAVSSAHGMAGVAVIRVSGPQAGLCSEAVAGQLPEPRHASLRKFRHPVSAEIIDQGLLLWFPAPASFTGEDCAEFHVHGSAAVIDAMCGALRAMARPAEAGEFTRRAFRNGRLDLTAAEGLADLLEARTERQRRQALHHALGGAGRKYDCWRDEIIAILGRVEAAVDFSDEADIASQAMAGVMERCATLIADMESALAESEAGQIVRDGLTVVLAGAPNVGKSSLLNALARQEVAIVSPRPGTTRDVIGAEIVLAGIPVRLRDTAGLRQATSDEIEAEGMARARGEWRRADLRLWISAPDVAGSSPEPPLDPDTIWIENKADLPQSQPIRQRNDFGRGPHYRISAKFGAGIVALLGELENRVKSLSEVVDNPSIVRSRHVDATRQAIDALKRASSIPNHQLELVGEEMRSAAFHLGRVTGRIGVEDLLDSIFKSFCIGK